MVDAKENENEGASKDTTDALLDQGTKNNPDRWQVLMDLLAFQFKLALDAIRDVLLSPVSIAIALFGIITNQKNPGKYFYGLLRQGHKSDSWINLFGTASRQEEIESSSDVYVRKLENLVVDEYKKGGLVKNLKDKADRMIDKASRD